MSIGPDEALLDEVRVPGRCEACGCWCPNGREASHTFTKGTGGGGQLDIPANITGLCSLDRRACHRRHHDGHWPKTWDLVVATAIRLRVPAPMPLAAQAVLTELHRARRMVKPQSYTCPFTGREWHR